MYQISIFCLLLLNILQKNKKFIKTKKQKFFVFADNHSQKFSHFVRISHFLTTLQNVRNASDRSNYLNQKLKLTFCEMFLLHSTYSQAPMGLIHLIFLIVDLSFEANSKRHLLIPLFSYLGPLCTASSTRAKNGNGIDLARRKRH